jgi:hypothetical protein
MISSSLVGPAYQPNTETVCLAGLRLGWTMGRPVGCGPGKLLLFFFCLALLSFSVFCFALFYLNLNLVWMVLGLRILIKCEYDSTGAIFCIKYNM